MSEYISSSEQKMPFSYVPKGRFTWRLATSSKTRAALQTPLSVHGFGFMLEEEARLLIRALCNPDTFGKSDKPCSHSIAIDINPNTFVVIVQKHFDTQAQVPVIPTDAKKARRSPNEFYLDSCAPNAAYNKLPTSYKPSLFISRFPSLKLGDIERIFVTTKDIVVTWKRTMA